MSTLSEKFKLAFSKKANKATTLDGYGITDAVSLVDGNLKLGNTTLSEEQLTKLLALIS